jgi:hypothetical protein
VSQQQLGTKILFKGVGPGTHWYENDPLQHGQGFTASSLPTTPNAVVTHIGYRPYPSAFLSVSLSFAAAREYALFGPKGKASAVMPGYVYEIDLSAITSPVALVDPIREIASGHTNMAVHEHDGNQGLVGEIAGGSPTLNPAHQRDGTLRPPAVSPQLRALIFAIRDAELLIQSGIPAGAIVHRYKVW